MRDRKKERKTPVNSRGGETKKKRDEEERKNNYIMQVVEEGLHISSNYRELTLLTGERVLVRVSYNETEAVKG